MRNFSEIKLMIMEREDERAKSLIEYFDLYNAANTSQTTLLHYAAHHGNENITKYLLEKGSSVDSQNMEGDTPLIMALRRNHRQVMKILLEAGADVTALDKKNQNALHFLATKHRLPLALYRLFFQSLQKKCSTSEEIAKKMIDANCCVYQAVCLNDAVAIKYMLEQGFLNNFMNPLNKQTALHIAVALENVEIVRLLLDYGADVNALDINDANPLSYLYKNTEHTHEKIEILQILLGLKTSLMSCTSRGVFQVSDILAYGNHEVIRLILQSSINFTSKCVFEDRSVLHILAVNYNPGVVEELKCYADKFDVNVNDKCNVSPLIIAAMFANVEMVKFFIEQGADIDHADCIYNFTALHNIYVIRRSGLENEYDQCIELLLQHNANPQLFATSQSGKQYTIFDIASTANRLSTVKPMIAHLAMLEARGTSITELIDSKINSYPELKTYFKKCRRILGKEIVGSTTLLTLLSDDKKKIASRFKTKKSILKLERMSYNSRTIFLHSYYYNSLRKKLSKGLHDKRFRIKASEVVCKILRAPFHKTHLVVQKIVDYLSHENLCQLYEF